MFHVRENIVDYFWKGIFLLKGNAFKTKEEKSEEKTEKFINDGMVLFFLKKNQKT